jgi:hypothetical protein
MRRAGILILIAALPACAQLVKRVQMAKPAPAVASIDQPRFSFDVIRNLEKDFENKLEGASQDRMKVIGAVRGLYLPGYGLVFTAEMDLAMTPIAGGLFKREISPGERSDIHKKKLEQLPLVQQLMREMAASAAQKVDMMPESERIVVAVRFWYQGWEDQTRLPTQITMSGDRKSVMSGLVKEDFTK